MIKVDKLSVAFGSGAGMFVAVHEASFAVPTGEAFGLVGESGCGKSTMLRAIAGVLPFTGSIELAGRRVGRHRSKAQRKLVQMVFQDPYGSLHPAHTVDHILSEALIIHRMPNVDARIEAVLRDVGLGPQHRFRYPHQLSGGQRQRVAIARTLMIEPEILLLDEPTSALDVSVQAEILNLLKRLRAEHGLTMLMVSHDLAVIAHMCERIAVMFRGEVVETLPVERLRRREADHPYTRTLLQASIAETEAFELRAAAAPAQGGRADKSIFVEQPHARRV
jgi:peptide/nickel transport system ATP-binding protein